MASINETGNADLRMTMGSTSLPRQRVPRTSSQQERPPPPSNASVRVHPSLRRPATRRRRRLPSTVVTGISLGLLLLLALLHHAWRIMILVGSDEDGDSRTLISKHFGLRRRQPRTTGSSVAPQHARRRPVLTAYLESPDSLPSDMHFPRTTSAERLKMVEFPSVQQCSSLHSTFPVDDFPADDPYLPWIHDFFPTNDGRFIQIVAQNKRRCDTGTKRGESMKHWEPQISLFQPIPIATVLTIPTGSPQQPIRYRLASPSDATSPETRFLCHFHDTKSSLNYTTLSEYSFNYEYVSWRKGHDSMYVQEPGKDVQQFWLSQLLFSCPVPPELVEHVASGDHVQDDASSLFLDIIPIRTPARYQQFLFTEEHVPGSTLEGMRHDGTLFNATEAWGDSHVLPAIQDSGRWANLPVCLPPGKPTTAKIVAAQAVPPPKHELVACTWTAASYTRRGDAVTMGDTSLRLREWIAFHLMVGFDHLYIYDNTVVNNATTDELSPLQKIVEEFLPDEVTYHSWPCQVCNNNRPNNPNPGERSSQYAAEASCRERYGPTADWMAFIDTDEYLVPMAADTWSPILKQMKEREFKILKMRSSRTKPRPDLMEVSEDQSTCVETNPKDENITLLPCIAPRKNETFLRVYNCEFIKPPRPDRFERAMKQIYRPSHVWNHFVHYSTVTADVARFYKDFGPDEPYARSVHAQSWIDHAPEVFLNERTEGTLVHTKSVLPHETMRRANECHLDSKFNCALGFPCPDHVEFSDAEHKANGFHDDEGEYCNCWMNSRVETVFVPKLETYLAEHLNRVRH